MQIEGHFGPNIALPKISTNDMGIEVTRPDAYAARARAMCGCARTANEGADMPANVELLAKAKQPAEDAMRSP